MAFATKIIIRFFMFLYLRFVVHIFSCCPYFGSCGSNLNKKFCLLVNRTWYRYHHQECSLTRWEDTLQLLWVQHTYIYTLSSCKCIFRKCRLRSISNSKSVHQTQVNSSKVQITKFSMFGDIQTSPSFLSLGGTPCTPHPLQGLTSELKMLLTPLRWLANWLSCKLSEKLELLFLLKVIQ